MIKDKHFNVSDDQKTVYDKTGKVLLDSPQTKRVITYGSIPIFKQKKERTETLFDANGHPMPDAENVWCAEVMENGSYNVTHTPYSNPKYYINPDILPVLKTRHFIIIKNKSSNDYTFQTRSGKTFAQGFSYSLAGQYSVPFRPFHKSPYICITGKKGQTLYDKKGNVLPYALDCKRIVLFDDTKYYVTPQFQNTEYKHYTPVGKLYAKHPIIALALHMTVTWCALQIVLQGIRFAEKQLFPSENIPTETKTDKAQQKKPIKVATQPSKKPLNNHTQSKQRE